MARKRKPPFKVKIYDYQRCSWDELTPRTTETVKKESEAQTIAKRAVRRRAWKVIIVDGNGDICWDSHYTGSMPIDVPKM